MIGFLKGKIPKEVHERLVEFQDMVMKLMSAEDADEKTRLSDTLAVTSKNLKEIVGNYKRVSESK